MFSVRRFSLGLPLALGLGIATLGIPVVGHVALGTSVAHAEEDQGSGRRTRKVVAMSNKVLEKIQQVSQLINPEDEEGKKKENFTPNYREALKILNEVRQWDDLNSADRTQLWNFYGYVYISMDDYPRAIQSYEQILKIEDADPRFQTSIMYNLAQLYMATEQYQKTISMLDRWFKVSDGPSPQAYLLYGQAYYLLDNFRKARQPVEQAIDLAKERGEEIQESWYQLIRHIYYELGEKEKALDIVQILVKNWPKKIYWLQLSSMYGELNREKLQLSAMEAAYRNGYLTQTKELENLAQLYLYHGVPYKAAKVVQQGLKDGTVEKTEDNWELLSRGWINAQEYAKAVEPLRQAASMSEDGDLYMRLAQVYSQLENPAKTVESVQLALKKGGLKRPDDAYVVKGMAEFDLDRLSDAKKSFQQAAKSKDSRKMAQNWIKYIDNEAKRREEIRKFLEN
jgi:tetratricopeptide (TPR) repeat protein